MVSILEQFGLIHTVLVVAFAVEFAFRRSLVRSFVCESIQQQHSNIIHERRLIYFFVPCIQIMLVAWYLFISSFSQSHFNPIYIEAHDQKLFAWLCFALAWLTVQFTHSKREKDTHTPSRPSSQQAMHAQHSTAQYSHMHTHTQSNIQFIIIIANNIIQRLFAYFTLIRSFGCSVVRLIHSTPRALYRAYICRRCVQRVCFTHTEHTAPQRLSIFSTRYLTLTKMPNKQQRSHQQPIQMGTGKM